MTNLWTIQSDWTTLTNSGEVYTNRGLSENITWIWFGLANVFTEAALSHKHSSKWMFFFFKKETAPAHICGKHQSHFFFFGNAVAALNPTLRPSTWVVSTTTTTTSGSGLVPANNSEQSHTVIMDQSCNVCLVNINTLKAICKPPALLFFLPSICVGWLGYWARKPKWKHLGKRAQLPVNLRMDLFPWFPKISVSTATQSN